MCVSVGATIDFSSVDGPDFGTFTEGQSVTFGVNGIGFGYEVIPILVTPLPCSDYPGNLSALFSNVPAASASVGKCTLSVSPYLTFLGLESSLSKIYY